jgi:hypothetical protein
MAWLLLPILESAFIANCIGKIPPVDCQEETNCGANQESMYTHDEHSSLVRDARTRDDGA